MQSNHSAIKLGPFTLDHPFILAPMAGITHSVFRRLMRRHGSAMVVSELISACGILYGSANTLDLLKFHEEERCLGFQIFGHDTEALCSAAQHLERLGVDFVDLNLGCPVGKVVQKGAGAAMCRDLLGLRKTLECLVRSVRIPVSIKIRTGWDAHSRNALEVVRVASDAGVSWVAIHGRTRAQGYQGRADWEFIGNVKAKSSLPILGNGDLMTAQSAWEAYHTYQVDGVLIGRAALKNPFIFEQAFSLGRGDPVEPVHAERYLDLLRELRALLEQEPQRRSMLYARKFLAWFASGFPGCHGFRTQVFSILSAEDLWEESFRFFGSQVLRDDSFDPSFLAGGHG